MFYIVSFLWVQVISAILVAITKRKYELNVALTYILGAFFLYIFTYFNKLRLGYYCLLGVAGLSLIYLIYKSIKDKEFFNRFKKNYFTLGFVAFSLLLVYAYFLYGNKGFENCDEFMHWGPMVEETLRLNGFYSLPESVLRTHKDYPPFFCMIESLWCLFGGGYKETFTYMGLVTFIWSLLMPLYKDLDIKNSKDYLKSILLLISIIFLGLINSRTVTASDWAFIYNSIYVDWALGFFLAYSLYIVYIEKDWNLVSLIHICLCLSSLLLMKQMGVPFYLLTGLFIFIKIVFIDKKKEYIKYVLFFLIIPIAWYLSWKHVVSLYSISGQFNVGDINLNSFLDIIKGTVQDEAFKYRSEVFTTFISQLIARPLYYYPAKMTFFLIVVIQTIIICLFKRKENYCLAGVYLFGSVAYSFTLLILYLYSFSYEEALELASFDRYMNSYLLAGTTLCLMLTFNQIKKSISYAITLAILLLFVEYNDLSHINPLANNGKLYTNVLIVDQQGFYNEPMDRNYLDGLRVNFDRLDYYTYDENNIGELKEKISQYGAIYIMSYDDEFLKAWIEISGIDYIETNDIYDIGVENNEIKFYKETMYLKQVILYYFI